jgi:hypothetical protein
MQAFTDKRGKPYAQCTPCGAQFFVRTKQGTERFVARYGTPGKKGSPAPAPEPVKATKPAPTRQPQPSKGDAGEKKDDYWNW